MKIEVKNLCKTYQDHQVLKDLNLTVKDHEIVTLMGPSGSGKSTLLRCLCDLEEADSGSIQINGRYLISMEEGQRRYATTTLRKQIAKDIHLVFQNYQLFPHCSILQNLMLAPIYHRLMSKKKALLKARELLKTLEINDKSNVYPNTLSGGEKQRVAIARACMLQPKLLCFDEPTSALDKESINLVISIIKELRKEMSILIITHDEDFANKIATGIVKIKDINMGTCGS